MAKITLVTGGARSGKSQFAEDLLQNQANVCYLATSVVISKDADLERRIALHQQRRPKTWGSHEAYQDLAKFIKAQSYEYYLLDCVTMFVTNHFFDYIAKNFPNQDIFKQDEFLTTKQQEEILLHLLAEWQLIIEAVKKHHKQIVIVTNEIGMGIVPETPIGRLFRDYIGKINQFLAKEATEVYLVICGLCQKLK